jgi:hypothetical protein
MTLKSMFEVGAATAKIFYYLVQAELVAQERMNNAFLARYGHYL